MASTGPVLLPSPGQLSYNGVLFSVLFKSSIRTMRV